MLIVTSQRTGIFPSCLAHYHPLSFFFIPGNFIKTLTLFCEETVKFTWRNMGPLRMEFAFLSLSFSQDVMLPYIAVNGVSQTFCELRWRQNCWSLWMVIFLCFWEPSHGEIPKSACTKGWTCLICMKGTSYIYACTCTQLVVFTVHTYSLLINTFYIVFST